MCPSAECLSDGALFTDILTLGEASPAVKSETSTATSMIQDEEATVVQLPTSVRRRKIRTAKEGSVGSRDTAGVSNRRTPIVTPHVTCIPMSGISSVSAIA